MGKKNRGHSPSRTAAAASGSNAPVETTEEGSSQAVPADPPKEPTPPIAVLYCQVCTFPVEYCEFGSSLTRCKEWLKEANQELYDRYYSEKALEAKMGMLTIEAQNKLQKDSAKKEAKAEAKAEAALKKKMASQVTIKRIERTKRKHVTSIHGLEAFDIDLKKAAKQLAGRFATGASVTKNVQGQDEIVVQGDVADEVVDILKKGEGVLKGVPKANVDIVV